MNPTSAQVASLIKAASNASGLLEAMELIRPDLAKKINPVRTELARSVWAAMGRPTPLAEGVTQQ